MELEDMKKNEEGVLLFEQPYVSARVIEVGGGWDIEFAVLGASSIAIREDSEIQAKAIYAGLDVAYRAGLADLQAKMLEALESIVDGSKEGESSNTVSPDHNEDK